MNNYGEELAYWYLRLNGFFPISNFVVHRSSGVTYSADVDVLAIRPPFVFEEVGGQPYDWDSFLQQNLPFEHQIGLVCEVKTGGFEEKKLFRTEHIRYTLPRLGLVEQHMINDVLANMENSPVVEVLGGAVIAKLFVSDKKHSAGPYLNRTLYQIEDFLLERVNRYPIEKYGDRMFFPSSIFQLIIAQVNRSIRERNAA